MKKLFVLFALIFAFVTLSAVEVSAQGIVGVKSYNLGTVSNSVDESYVTGVFSNLLKEFGCSVIDSMVISLTVKNETDIDSCDFYPCNWTIDGTKVLGTVAHFAVTLNVAAAGTGTEALYTATTLHGVWAISYRGFEGFAILTRGSTAGNDPTDPNSGKLTITFFGS